MEPPELQQRGITPSPAKKRCDARDSARDRPPLTRARARIRSKLDANLAAPTVCGTCGTSNFAIACPCCAPPAADGAARPEAAPAGDARPPATDASRKATTRREGALAWDDYFMAVAFLSAQRSKDPSTQVGACIVNERNRIVGIGCARARARPLRGRAPRSTRHP